MIIFNIMKLQLPGVWLRANNWVREGVIRLSPSLCSNRGMSTAYTIIIGFMGIVSVGFMWAIQDQLVLGEIWNFNISNQLSGTFLQLYKTMWLFIPIAVVASFIVGSVAVAHDMRNQ